VRVLHSLSRFDETPDKLVINYQDGQYISLGTLSQVTTAQVRDAILAAALSSEGEAEKADHILTDAEVKPALGKDVIAQLFKEGRLLRIGSGEKGDPYCYWNPHFIPPPYIVEDPAE
jgi:hypothetical protein